MCGARGTFPTPLPTLAFFLYRRVTLNQLQLQAVKPQAAQQARQYPRLTQAIQAPMEAHCMLSQMRITFGFFHSPLRCQRRLQQMQLQLFKTDAAQKQRLDLQLTRMIVSCNMPFLSAGDQELRKFVTMLRPGYKPPCRQTVCRNCSLSHCLTPFFPPCRLLAHYWTNSTRKNT